MTDALASRHPKVVPIPMRHPGLEPHLAPRRLLITSAAAHLRHIERASVRRMRKLTQDAISAACREARERGATPLGAVDDLSVHSLGRWTADFAKALARSARREGVGIVGGEMAQMPDTYAPGYAGIWVTVVSIKSAHKELARQ